MMVALTPARGSIPGIPLLLSVFAPWVGFRVSVTVAAWSRGLQALVNRLGDTQPDGT